MVISAEKLIKSWQSKIMKIEPPKKPLNLDPIGLERNFTYYVNCGEWLVKAQSTLSSSEWMTIENQQGKSFILRAMETFHWWKTLTPQQQKTWLTIPMRYVASYGAYYLTKLSSEQLDECWDLLQVIVKHRGFLPGDILSQITRLYLPASVFAEEDESWADWEDEDGEDED